MKKGTFKIKEESNITGNSITAIVRFADAKWPQKVFVLSDKFNGKWGVDLSPTYTRCIINTRLQIKAVAAALALFDNMSNLKKGDLMSYALCRGCGIEFDTIFLKKENAYPNGDYYHCAECSGNNRAK